jgi:hypothetical protein
MTQLIEVSTIEVEGVTIEVRDGYGDIDGDKAYRLQGSFTWIFTDKEKSHEQVIAWLVKKVKNPSTEVSRHTIRLG